MAQYKVRHGLVNYRFENRIETAFRGQVIDLNDKDAERLLEYNAIIAEDEELPRAGTLLVLPETASDEEIRNWVANATDVEVATAAEQRPMLAARLRAAHEGVKVELKHQQEHLGRAAQVAEEATEEGDGSPPSEEAGSGDESPSDEELAQEADGVVRRNVDAVSQYLSEHPERAQVVLDAETRRAADAGEEPRRGVRQAVEVAAQHHSAG